MLKLFRIMGSVFLCALPFPALSEISCEKLPDPIETLEIAKNKFASGHYDDFFAKANRVVNTAATSEPFGTVIRDAFPQGFELCSTIMSRRISERFVSEIVVFIGPRKKVLFFGWDAIRITGDWEIARYRLESDFETIMSDWRP